VKNYGKNQLNLHMARCGKETLHYDKANQHRKRVWLLLDCERIFFHWHKVSRFSAQRNLKTEMCGIHICTILGSYI